MNHIKSILQTVVLICCYAGLRRKIKLLTGDETIQQKQTGNNDQFTEFLYMKAAAYGPCP